ncbi:MAG: MerR family transcriptional regulator [Nocardioidaceae bacterium]
MKSSRDTMMSIGDLAQRFGIATHVLRHWESMGLLSPATRINGRRYYTRDHVVRVATIMGSKAGGLSLTQIRDLLAAPSAAARRRLLADHAAELDRRMAEIAAAKQMVAHAMSCRSGDIAQCPNFRRMVRNMMDDPSPEGAIAVPEHWRGGMSWHPSP